MLRQWTLLGQRSSISVIRATRRFSVVRSFLTTQHQPLLISSTTTNNQHNQHQRHSISAYIHPSSLSSKSIPQQQQQQLRTMSSNEATSSSADPAQFPVQAGMEQALREAEELQPLQHLEIWNESHKHSVPKNSETHFKVILVSEQFQGVTPIQRHRMVNAALKPFMDNPVHALSIVAKTPEQWQAMLDKGERVEPSPNCRGGNKL